MAPLQVEAVAAELMARAAATPGPGFSPVVKERAQPAGADR